MGSAVREGLLWSITQLSFTLSRWASSVVVKTSYGNAGACFLLSLSISAGYSVEVSFIRILDAMVTSEPHPQLGEIFGLSQHAILGVFGCWMTSAPNQLFRPLFLAFVTSPASASAN